MIAAQTEARRARRPTPKLEQARAVGDPVADVLVAKLLRAQSFKVDATLAALASGDARAIERLPDALRRFLETEGLPPRTDPARLLAAQRFAQRHSIAISIALFCAALPAAFTGAKGVAVLHSTGRLRDDLDRRVNETGRFVFDVLRPGSFETGRALLAIQCVRLVHAAVRVRALRGAPAGEAAPQEIPLNQEDLLGTLACFSVVVLDAMRKMGVAVSAADAEDYVYLWRTVGAVLGIQPGLLPRDLAAAERQRDLVFQRQGRPSRDGRELATILVDGIERHLPARGASVLVPSLIHLFLGDAGAAVLGLRESLRPMDLERVLPAARAFFERAGRTFFGAAAPAMERGALEGVLALKLAGAEPAFYRPLAAATPQRRRGARPGPRLP